jgi:hypothetical protein
VDGTTTRTFVPASSNIQAKFLIFGEHRKTITVSENIRREELRKRASHEFQGRVAIQPEVFPIRDHSIVICYPSFTPEASRGDPIPTVLPYLSRANKLSPAEVPACAPFVDMATVASNAMGCPCLLKTDTRFRLRTDDRIEFKSEREIHLEAMKLEVLRA